MAREKKTVHRVQMTEGKRNIIQQLLQEYDIQSAEDGYKSKRINSSYGSMDIQVPQDRKSSFEPQIVKKRQKDSSDIDQKIISMYAYYSLNSSRHDHPADFRYTGRHLWL